VLTVIPTRSWGRYEKYSIIRNEADTFVNGGVGYGAYSSDSNGEAMRVLPLAGSVKKKTFCLEPGEYAIHAIDTAGDGWWDGACHDDEGCDGGLGAYYTVIADGATVVHEKMGRNSWSNQRSAFTVAPSRTVFSENKAPQGGGGAVFWESLPPVNADRYQDDSGSNTAAYGDFAATPAQTLSATKSSYRAISGKTMTDPIEIVLKDR
jgi:hypothetical protein